MADSFGIPQIKEYLLQMGLKIAQVNLEQQAIELAFHGDHGQWRMIIGIQQGNDAKKLMLIAPHVGSVTTKKRLECLEALMAVNYHIAIGKFGLDLEDGEIRLEETIPLADNILTFEQFQLALGAIMQTVAMYQSLIPRIVYSNLSVQDALKACEHDFFRDEAQGAETPLIAGPLTVEEEVDEERLPELDVDDILAEVTRMLEKHKES